MEGTYLYRRGQYWYAFVSTGEFNNDTYKLKVGRASRITDVFYDKNNVALTNGLGGTIILSTYSGGRYYGCGHNGEIFETKDGKTWMYYHCHDRAVVSKLPNSITYRPLFLQEIKWDSDGWPYFEDDTVSNIAPSPIGTF